MNKETVGTEVGGRIKQIRKTLNLQQKDFAVRMELSGPSLSEIESGKYKPGFDFLVKLSQEFNVNIHYVLFGEGAMFLGPGRRFVDKAKIVGGNSEDVRKFYWYFERSSIIHYYILSAFKNKLLENKANIDREVEEYETDGGTAGES